MDALIVDMRRFAVLLDVVGLPTLGHNYSKLADSLAEDSSEEKVEAARKWIANTFSYGGHGSIFDRYVPDPEFGSWDRVLTGEYEEVAQRLDSFASEQRF